MKLDLRYIYCFTISLSLFASLYSFLVPSISKPIFPSDEIKKSFLKLDSSSLVSVKTIQSTKDSSDRKLSSIYLYSFDDKSSILASIVRVRKRDDFKIETYGLLTKGISEFYIQNPRMTNSVPYSIYGLVGNRNSYQTCIVPRTTKLDEVDIRLSRLTTAVENLDTTRRNLLSKLLGNEKTHDYSCLVLTYQPSSESKRSDHSKTWQSIIDLAQMALAR